MKKTKSVLPVGYRLGEAPWKPEPFKAYPLDQGFKSIAFAIDMVILSSTRDVGTIGHVLTENGFQKGDNVWVPRGSFERKVSYKKGADELSIHYHQRVDLGFIDSLIYLPRPSKDLMRDLALIFSANAIQYNFSKLKVSWNFEVKDSFEFGKFLASRVLLKRSLTPCEEGGCGEVFFANDGRRSSKSLRILADIPEFDRETVNLRFVMSNSLLKSCGITFPPIPESLEFKKFFEFYRLDTEALCSRILKSKRKKPGNRKLDIASRLHAQAREVFEKSPLMGTIEYLRSIGISRYSRFLMPMDMENALLHRAVQENVIKSAA